MSPARRGRRETPRNRPRLSFGAKRVQVLVGEPEGLQVEFLLRPRIGSPFAAQAGPFGLDRRVDGTDLDVGLPLVLWPEFCAAKALSAGSRKKWEPYFEALCQRIKSRDMSRVTEQHLLDWRDALFLRVKKGEIDAISIKTGQIAAAKAFFRWAKRVKRLLTDPSIEVHVEVSTKDKEKKRGFTDQEAATILSATLAPVNEFMTAENAAARRWVPWLCAYPRLRLRAGQGAPDQTEKTRSCKSKRK
jgi:hypothetical protein